MAITNPGIQGQDTELELRFSTGNVTIPVVNYDTFGARARKVQSQFITAQSTVTRFTNPREEIFVINITGKRGYNETYKDLMTYMDNDDFEGVNATDLPDHADLVAKYGKASIQMVEMNQPNEFGTYGIEVAYGVIETGYDEI